MKLAGKSAFCIAIFIALTMGIAEAQTAFGIDWETPDDIAKVSVNARDDYGVTALHHAIQYNRGSAVIQTLIDAGADN